MPAPLLSADVALAICAAREAGAKMKAAARAGGVTRRTVCNWLRRAKRECDAGEASPYVDFASAYAVATYSEQMARVRAAIAQNEARVAAALKFAT